MGLWYTVKFPHMTLGLVPKVLDPIDVIMSVGKQFRMVDPVVFELGRIQHIIAPPAVTISLKQ